MKFLALGLSIFLVILGAYASRRYQISSAPPQTKEVLSQSEEVEKEENIEAATPTPEPSESSTPGLPSSRELGVSNFIYPGASVKSQTSSTLSLESSNDTDVITDWYKDKIKSMGANVKSFVVTRANDKVLNKLVGANAEIEVAVEISKDPGSTIAKISVVLK